MVDCSHIYFPFLEKGLYIPSSAVPSRAPCGTSILPYPINVRLNDMSHFDQTNVHGGDTQHVQDALRTSTCLHRSILPSASVLSRGCLKPELRYHVKQSYRRWTPTSDMPCTQKINICIYKPPNCWGWYCSKAD